MDINSLWLRWPSPSASKIWNTVLTKCGLNFWPVHTNTALWKSSEQNIYYKAKIKKMFVSRTRLTVRKCFWVICDAFFFPFFLVTGNRDRKFRYCSRIYGWNWFTLLNDQNLLLDFERTRFVNELWKKKKKYPPTHRPIGEMGGRVRETNIFLRMA